MGHLGHARVEIRRSSENKAMTVPARVIEHELRVRPAGYLQVPTDAYRLARNFFIRLAEGKIVLLVLGMMLVY